MRKKIIYKDEKAINELIASRKKLAEITNKLCEALEKEGITPTKEIITNGLDPHSGFQYLADLIVQTIVDNRNKLGIQVYSAEMELLKNSSLEVVSRFELEDIQRSIQVEALYAGIYVDGLTFENGRALVTKEDENEISKQNSVSLNSKDTEVHDKITELLKTIKETESWLKEKGESTIVSSILKQYTENPGFFTPIVKINANAEEIQINPYYFDR